MRNNMNTYKSRRMTESITTEDIRRKLATVPYGKSIQIPKSAMPDLPSDFRETHWGTPLWLAHPGATAQYRAAIGGDNLHAYDVSGAWDLHHDKYPPGDIRHLSEAPEVPIAFLAASVVGTIMYLFLDRKEKEKEEEDRIPQWLLAIASIAVAAIVGFLVYLLCAGIRINMA